MTASAAASEPLKESAASPAASVDGGRADRTGMLRAAAIVSGMTVLSRVLGLWRDRLLAAAFGASGVSDAFNLAFILPNLTRRLFGEGALSSAFVPVFTERLATDRRAAAFRTASVLLSRLALGLFIVCVGLVAVSLGVRFTATLEADTALTLRLAEVMIGYCVLINVAAVLMGILNSLGHFTAPAFAPVLLNLSMIVACKFGLGWLGDGKENQVMVVALAVVAGGVLQLFIMLPPALARGFTLSPSLDKNDEGYSEVMTNFLPVVLGVALFQLNLLVDQFIATIFIPEDGPVTMLAYGNRLIQLPWAIFSLALATAALPMLSRYWAEGKKDEFGRATGSAVRATLFLAAPSTVGLCILSTDLVRLFYGTGEFLRNDGEAVIRTGRVVFCFSLGLCFYSLNSVLARAIYATKDTRSPTRAAAISVGVNLALNVLFVLGPRIPGWRAAGLPDLKEAGLALSSAISGGVQTFLMARVLMRSLPRPDAPQRAAFLASVGASSLIGGVLAVVAYGKLAHSQTMEGFLAFFAAAGAAIVPPYALGSLFFRSQLKALRSPDQPPDPAHPFGVPLEKWPADLLFYHSLYTTLLTCIVMGLMVWAVRDSVPPEGSFPLVFQRAIVPVAAGVVVFAIAAGGFQSREYEELKSALARKWWRRGK